MPTENKASRPCEGSGHRVLSAQGLRHWRVFPGYGEELAQMRRWLSSILPSCPARDDVLSVATELGSNALTHTASGMPGGSFAVEVTSDQSSMQVAVADGGADTHPRIVNDPEGECGRGLMLVHALSVQFGWTGDHQGRLVWARIAWPDQHLVQDAQPQALAWAEGAPFKPPATVGRVLDQCRVGQLRRIAGLGPHRRGEIEVAMVVAGLALKVSGGQGSS